MSRIGEQPIKLPEGTTASIDGGELVVKGPKGELKLPYFPQLNVDIKKELVKISKKKKTDKTNALHGLLRALMANAVEGVSKGFEKRLELVGTGYRVKKEGNKLILSLGLSHQVVVEADEGVELDIEGEKEIIVRGIDKQKVGQKAADIRSHREPEPYKGKGIRYQGEIVRRKPGKAAKVGTAGA